VSGNRLDRRERRTRRLVRFLQLALVLLAAATGVLAWREATRPPAAIPEVLLPAPAAERDARAQAAARAALEQSGARIRELEGERDRLAAEVEQLRDRLAALEARIATLEQALAGERQEARRRATSLERERDRNQQLWLRLQRAEAELARARAELEAARRAATPAPATTAGGGTAAPPAEQSAAEAAAASGVGTRAWEETPTARLLPLRVSDGVEAYRRGDYRRAFEIWRPLAEAGNAKAQFHLGAMLFEGRLGPPDNVEAYVWLERAVRGGYRPAAGLRDRVRALLGPDELRRAQEMSDS